MSHDDKCNDMTKTYLPLDSDNVLDNKDMRSIISVDTDTGSNISSFDSDDFNEKSNFVEFNYDSEDDIEAYIGEKINRESHKLINKNYLENPLGKYLYNQTGLETEFNYNFNNLINSVGDSFSNLPNEHGLVNNINVFICIGYFVISLLFFTSIMLIF